MTFFLLALVVVAFFGCRVYLRPHDWNDACLTRDGTLAVNGVFVLLVMLSHGKGYLPAFGAFDTGYLAVQDFLGQLIVASFLFYSGYGIHLQLSKRGDSYRKTLLSHRLLKVLFHFDIAVLLFLILQTILGQRFPVRQILLSFIAWDKLGNSNWYIFAVLCLYVMVWLGYTVFRRHDLASLIAVTALCAVYVVVMEHFGNRSSDCWYNTVFCFPAGMWLSRTQDKVLPAIRKRPWLWAVLLVTSAAAVWAAHLPQGLLRNPWAHNLYAVVFALGVVLLTMKLRIGNKIICFAGSLTFWLYILQRLPYIALQKTGLADASPYLYLIVCIAITVCLAFAADKLVSRLDRVIWRK